MVWLKRDALTVLSPRSRGDLPAPSGKDRAATPSARCAEARLPAANGRAKDALAWIRGLIEDGRFPPGSRLPAERKLAEQMTVGRPVVREAIKALTALGMVESRRGSGTYVRAVAPATAAGGIPAEARADFSLLHLCEVRKMIEPRAAWLTATRADERQLAEIENARQRLETHDRDWKLATRLDVEFHRAILRGAQNPVLDAIHEFIAAGLLAAQSGTVRLSPAPESLRESHRRIAESILRRQADKAEEAMREHLDAADQEFFGGT